MRKLRPKALKGLLGLPCNSVSVALGSTYPNLPSSPETPRTCFELGNGAEEGSSSLGTSINERHCVVATVEGRLAKSTQQLVVIAAVLDDAAGRVVNANPLVLVLHASVHKHMVLPGHICMDVLETVIA